MAITTRTLVAGVAAVTIPVLIACSGCFTTDAEEGISAEEAARKEKLRNADPLGEARKEPKKPVDRTELQARRAEQKAKEGAARGAKITSMELEPTERTPAAEVAAARDLILSGDAAKVEEGRGALDTWIAANSDDADAFFWRGRAFREAGDYDKAMPDFGIAAEKDAGWLDAQIWAASTVLYVGGCAEAMSYLDTMVSLAPDEASVYYDRAQCRARVKDFDGSVSDAKKACEMGNEAACGLARRSEFRGGGKLRGKGKKADAEE